MSNCADFERLMEGMLAGDYDPGADGASPKWAVAARRDLLAHVDGCDACGELYGFHEWLAREAPALEEIQPRELEAVRHEVLARIREEAPAGMRSDSGSARMPATRLALAGAAAALLLAAGVLLGRIALPDAPAQAEGARLAGASGPAGPGVTGETIATLGAFPYSFANVSVEPGRANLVRLSFDMTRRVRTERPQDDPLVREVLIQSLRGASPLGDRLRALSLAGEFMDAGIREALIDTMRSDASMAVRLRALETLSAYPADADIQQSMLAVLEQEESVQMRLLAIDYLGAGRVAPDRIRTALEETRPDGAEALYIRASERLGL